MDIGKIIKKYRKQANLTQKELGIKIGVSQQQIGMWENGKRIPKIDTLKKIADSLNVPLLNFTNQEDILNYTREARTKLSYEDIFNLFVDMSEQPLDEKYFDMMELQLYKKLYDKPAYSTMLRLFKLLNDDGQKKALEQVELLTKIPEYRIELDGEPFQ